MCRPSLYHNQVVPKISLSKMLENTPNVDFWQDMVKEVIVSRGTIKGVVTGMGQTIYSKTVILTNGTFLNGVIHIGLALQ